VGQENRPLVPSSREEKRMGKIAFLFSGQGSQYVGMGKDLYDHNPAARVIFDQTDSELSYGLSRLCFSGAQEELNRTENTQPAILAVSIAAFEALKGHGIFPDVIAGFSLGEYSALVCSEVLNYREAVKLVRKRGLYMQEAVPEGQGGMAAVLGMDTSKVEEACTAVGNEAVIKVANYNCPGQVVISGEKKALEAASSKLAEFGAKKVIPLQVSGPFHTSFMQPAAEKLKRELSLLEFGQPKYPIISNVTADYIKDSLHVAELLPRQVMNSVLWEMSIRKMLADGVDTFIEIGPGSTLRGFVRKINKNTTLLNVEDMSSLNSTVKFLNP